MIARTTRARRLEAAGYAYVQGWVPVEYAADVMEVVDHYTKNVEDIATTLGKRGRPWPEKADKSAPNLHDC